MWPLLLDMTREESVQKLRNLELEAYSQLVSALRAQGPLNSEKRRLLKESSAALNITQERYKAEIRRAVSDEQLNTIAFHLGEQIESSDGWAQEGRRLVPLLPRVSPQTAYTSFADEVADSTGQINKHLPLPSSTERKRHFIPSVNSLNNNDSKGIPFRMPESVKLDDCKKRKLSISSENSCLAQHLLGPAKMSKIQQIYRPSSTLHLNLSKEAGLLFCRHRYRLKIHYEFLAVSGIAVNSTHYRDWPSTSSSQYQTWG